MTAAVWGVLLLCCALPGDTEKPLTMAQFRNLSASVQASDQGSEDPFQEVTVSTLRRLGYDEAAARRIVTLLSREEPLRDYLKRAESQNIGVVTRLEPEYPEKLIRTLGHTCPPVLFYRGDASLLQKRCISVVGSREPTEEAKSFAKRMGCLIAAEGVSLCSGGAKGIDSAAQRACLQSGGEAVIFPAVSLLEFPEKSHVIYVSEAAYDADFSTPRALSRNRLIHAMGEKTFVCQPRDGVGGTWSGTADNLRHGYSPVFVLDDGSPAVQHLLEKGAVAVRQVDRLSDAQDPQLSFI